MLTELKNVKQESTHEGLRRWFSDEEIELILWLTKDGAFEGFQLCYDREGHERSITFDGTKYEFDHIDSGEQDPSENNSPILTPDPSPDLRLAIQEFKDRSGELEVRIFQYVLTHLEQALERHGKTS